MNYFIKLEKRQIAKQYRDFELYYDRKEKVLYSTANAIAALLGCDKKSIVRKALALHAGKEAQILTDSGFRSGTLYTSSEVVEILTAIAQGNRTKKETRVNAANRLKQLAIVGHELAGMLTIAPDELAKIAINHIQDTRRMADVERYANQHVLYLREYHGLHDELKVHGAEGIHHAVVNKHNNGLVGIEKGQRQEMTEYQKDAMTFIQLAEKMKLAREQKKGAWNAVNVAKEAGDYAQESLLNLLK